MLKSICIVILRDQIIIKKNLKQFSDHWKIVMLISHILLSGKLEIPQLNFDVIKINKQIISILKSNNEKSFYKIKEN